MEINRRSTRNYGDLSPLSKFCIPLIKENSYEIEFIRTYVDVFYILKLIDFIIVFRLLQQNITQ